MNSEQANIAIGDSESKYWQKHVENYRTHPYQNPVIGGEKYYIGEENTAEMRGFGGRKWNIKFNDGLTVETTNLWHNGKVPDWLTDTLADNAVFIIENTAQKLEVINPSNFWTIEDIQRYNRSIQEVLQVERELEIPPDLAYKEIDQDQWKLPF